MTYSFWQAVAGTPWWVYVLFVFLVRVGLYARKPQVISIRQLLIFPAIFFGLSLFFLFKMQLGLLGFVCWAIAIFGGGGLGWLHFRLLKIKAIKDKARLYVPGSWSVLIIFMLIFAAKYYYNYQLEMNAQLLTNQTFVTVLALVYGLFTGLFIGRFTYARHCLRFGPFITEGEARVH